MGVLCITYDLRKPGQQWPELDDAIKGLGLGGGRALQSTWFVLSGKMDPSEILRRLRPTIDSNDKITIFRVMPPIEIQGLSPQWTEWLLNNVRA